MLRLASLRQGSRRAFSAQLALRVEKKDVGGEFPPKYTRSVESGWYEWWKERGFFSPSQHDAGEQRRPAEKKRFSMVLPPPNVTGVLHLGHALTATIQDALVRYHRMRGCDTVWIPGSDHAGIATQVVVEKHLAATEGLDRRQLGRAAFQQRVWDWRHDKGATILQQLEQLGASLDWQRTQFTLSPQLSAAVNHAFVTLFDKGLIYRKECLVNWCCLLQSTISDMEVAHVPVEKRTHFHLPGYSEPVEFGVLTDIAYKVVNSEEEIVVSTTRPETMLGDVAVAVHPSDDRYRHLIGGRVWHPFREEELPIIADEFVNMELGSGAVKITPAHDQTDFEVGVRHKLKFLNILEDNGRLNAQAGDFCGQHRFEARESVCERLDILGLYRGEREHSMMVPVCGRTGDVIEPLIKPQWFIDTSQMGELACRAVRDGDLRLDPPTYNAVWENFLSQEKNRDWCISRQLWWGHRIPAWLASHPASGRREWVAAPTEQAARVKAASKLGCKGEDLKLEQDEDVLDTWFSSAIYPFAVWGWPDSTPDLNKYFPLDMMETGHDILFFWVARMVMLSIALTGKLPFPDVMLHGVICDQDGRKMSKSLGNVIDPMHVIHGASLEHLLQSLDKSAKDGYLSEEEVATSKANTSNLFPDGISAHGADPLRWTLLSYDVKAQQINLDLSLVKNAGAWCNKIWQVSRFLLLAHQKAAEAGASLSNLPPDFRPRLMDMWMLNQLAKTISSVNEHFEEREFHQITRALRAFLHDDVCDVYVEYVKESLQSADHPHFLPSVLFLHSALITSLKLLHPLLPFLTEELYQRLPRLPNERRQESIMIDAYPQALEWNGFRNDHLARSVDVVLRVTRSVRSLRASYELEKDARPPVVVAIAEDHQEEEISTDELNQLADVVSCLGRCGPVRFVDQDLEPDSLPAGAVVLPVESMKICMDLGQHLNVQKEMDKLQAKMEKIAKDRLKLEKAGKGSFKFRQSKEQIQEKHQILDKNMETLEARMKILQSLQTKVVR